MCQNQIRRKKGGVVGEHCQVEGCRKTLEGWAERAGPWATDARAQGTKSAASWDACWKGTAGAASPLQPLRTAAPLVKVKCDLSEHCVCLEDLTSQSPVNTGRYSRLKSQLQVRKKTMQYDPPSTSTPPDSCIKICHLPTRRRMQNPASQPAVHAVVWSMHSSTVWSLSSSTGLPRTGKAASHTAQLHVESRDQRQQSNITVEGWSMKPESLQTDRTKTCHKAAVMWRQTACQAQSAYLHSSRLSKVYSAATASTYWRGCSTDLLLPPSAFLSS